MWPSWQQGLGCLNQTSRSDPCPQREGRVAAVGPLVILSVHRRLDVLEKDVLKAILSHISCKVNPPYTLLFWNYGIFHRRIPAPPLAIAGGLHMPFRKIIMGVLSCWHEVLRRPSTRGAGSSTPHELEQAPFGRQVCAVEIAFALSFFLSLPLLLSKVPLFTMMVAIH